MAEPAAKKAKVAQDFIKGWPHPSLLNYPELKKDLGESFTAALESTDSILNYGDKANGAYMLGIPDFRKVLAEFLARQYERPVDWQTVMSTGGSSMGTDVVARVHTKAGDYVVSEAPTYYLAHTMFRNRDLNLVEVPIEADGMDLVALEKLCKEKEGLVKMVYTVPVHHNPTGITMSNEKRKKLVALAQQYKFYIIADEAYQLLNFRPSGVVPLFYDDSESDPRVFSVGTFSKLIGPGTKVGWVQAHNSLLKPLQSIGFIDSGNNPVIFASGALKQFISSGNVDKHIKHVSEVLSKKCELMVAELKKVGLEPNTPGGGYFVWVKAKGNRTGRSGAGMALDPPDAFADYMRLCFAWLDEDQIVEGVQFLEED
jgi:DNA-binding transcriptional MocR family regulator